MLDHQIKKMQDGMHELCGPTEGAGLQIPMPHTCPIIWGLA